MDIQHEVGKRPLQSRQHTFQDDEASAGYPRRGLEIHHAERLADIDVIADIEVKRRQITHSPNLDICGLIEPVGHVIRRQIGERRKQLFDFRAEAALLFLALPNHHFELTDFIDQYLGFFASTLGRTDLLGRFVALVLGLLDLGLRCAMS